MMLLWKAVDDFICAWDELKHPRSEVGQFAPVWDKGTELPELREFASVRDKVPSDLQKYLSPYSPEELHKVGMTAYLAKDKQSGFAIAPDGDLVNVFSLNHKGRAAVEIAIKEGATKLDCFDGKLPGFYAKVGFREHKREPNWEPGGPDVVYMQIGARKAMENSTDSADKLKQEKREALIRWMRETGKSYADMEEAILDMMGDKVK